MNILHLCHLFYPSIGGTEQTVREISEQLVKQGDSVTVFTSNARSEEGFQGNKEFLLPPGEEIINDVRVVRFPVRTGVCKVPRFIGKGWRFLGLPGDMWLDMFRSEPCCPGMIWSTVMSQADVMLADPFVTSVVYYAYLGKRFRGTPLVYHTALHLEENDVFPRSIYAIMQNADALWVNTSFEADFLIDKGIPGKKIHSIGVGVDPQKFDGADGNSFRVKYNLIDKPIVLFLGRLIRDKGIITVLEAMESVWERKPDVVLVIAGIQTQFSRTVLHNTILDSSRPENILLLENLPQDEKKHVLSACDLFVLPSKVESFGIAYLEAWISGKPVIGARLGAVSSLISEGITGMLVEYGNQKEAAEKILYLLDNPEIRESMGTCGKELVMKKYTWDKITQQVRELYHMVANKR